MMSKTHKLGGITLGLTYFATVQKSISIDLLLPLGFILASSVIGSQLPDIDKKESSIGRKLWFISWSIYLTRTILRCISTIMGIRKKKFMKLVDENLGHRGITHSLPSWLVVTAILIFTNKMVKTLTLSFLHKYNLDFLSSYIYDITFYSTIGFSIGILSHIVLDCFTNNGVMLLAPISTKKIKIPMTIRTNSVLENVISITFSLLSSLLLINLLKG